MTPESSAELAMFHCLRPASTCWATLRSRMTGSALRGSAMRTTSRRPPASQQRATSRRSASVHDGDDVASDGEAASRGHGSDAEAEEEAGSPIVSVSRSLRRLTRAVSHTISGAHPTSPSPDDFLLG